MKMPLGFIDLRLIQYVEGPFAYTDVSEKKRLKLVEKDHQKCHKEGESHIHLDGSKDRLGG